MGSPKRKTLRIRPRSKPASPLRSRFAVFTAIDGTLLDSHTFDAGPNRAMIERLSEARIPVIPISVMTLGELTPIAADLGLHHAMVIEAGGAIARHAGGQWNVEPCGPASEILLEVIREIEDRSGASLLVCSALPQSDAARFTGHREAAEQFLPERCFSEPFLLESGELERVREAASAMGFAIRRGRRFLHLCRQCDQGEAFSRVRAEIGCEIAVAVGGSALDGEFLERADIAVIIPGPAGVDPELMVRLPEARIAPMGAPEGWSMAVEEVWQSLTAAQPVSLG
jgi:mannosyl-3-phosphoglycerate phosphatase